MVKVYTVCLGNICRSPIAEAVLRSELAAAGLSDQVELQSAGTAGYHVGENADRRTNRVLAENGYELDHSAQKFTAAMLAGADLVLVMDGSNYEDVMALAPQADSTTGTANTAKIKMMLEFSPHATQPDVPDPWYGNMTNFELVLSLIENATPGVVSYIQDELLR